MPTVNVHCGQCQQLMAVDTAHLGQQVRCPHCGTAVLAPPTAHVELAPAPTVTEQESIFGPTEPTSDDLFASPGAPGNEAPSWMKAPQPPPVAEDPSWMKPSEQPTPTPLVEDPSWMKTPEQPTPTVDDPSWMKTAEPAIPETAPAPAPSVPEPAPTPEIFAAETVEAPAPSESQPAGAETEPRLEETAAVQANLTPAPLTTDLATPPSAESAPLHSETTEQPPPPYRPITASGRSHIGLLIALIFLVPYAICVTAAAVYFYFQSVTIPHPLEVLPDVVGDHPGATHKDGHSVLLERPQPDIALPSRDYVALGKTLTVGDLEVEPEKIERAPITIYRPLLAGRETIPLAEGLMLTLRVRNVSKDDFFYPADDFFYRRWRPGDPPGDKPYTFLQVGDKRFYGGPVSWVPRGKDEAHYYVQGQENFDEVLKPGETRRLVICTDPEDGAVLRAVSDTADKLVWRVELRRGLVSYKNKEIPVCAVVAVPFSTRDIQ